MGKSALAYHFAKTYREHFPDGVVGLRVDGGHVDTIAARFAYHVGVEINPEHRLSASEIMQSVFSQKQALLIFDNAEDVAVNALQPGGDKCAVIVTTRNRSVFSGFGVPNTALVELPRFECEETKQMLIKILGEQRVLSEIEVVQDIHELVGGLPLALRIVGGFLVDQSFTSLAVYASMLRSEKTRLSYLRDRDDASLDVRASFELSLKYLDEEQINLFACLGACAPNGFSLETAQVVSEQAAGIVRNGLGRLIRLSLLSEGGNIERFVLHPLLFIFARELAEGLGLLASAEQRHTEYFRRYADEHRGLSPINLNTLASEFDALLLTAQRLTANRIADYGFYLSLEPFLQAKGYWTQALELIDLFLRVAQDNDDFYVVTQFLLQQGQFFQLQGNFKAAEQTLQKGEKTAYAIDNAWQQQRSLAMVLNSLGGIHQRQGKFDEAVAAFQQSYSLLIKVEDVRGQAMVLNSLGSVYQRQGKLDEAVAAFKQSYSISESVDDRRSLAMILNSLGSVYQRQGKFDEAVEVIQHSALIEEEIGNLRGQAMVLNSLGGIFQRQGKFDKAVQAFQQSSQIEEEIGNLRGQAMVLNSLGGVYQRQGRFDEAVDAFQRSYAISNSLNDQRSLAMVLNSLGGVYQRQGRFDEAVDAMRRSFAISDSLGDQRSLAMILNSLGGVYQRQGRFDEAVRAFERSMRIGEDLNDIRHLAMVYFAFGKALLYQGYYEQAVEKLKASFEIDESLSVTEGMRIVTPSLVRALTSLGRTDEANAYCTRALAIAPYDKRLLKIQDQLSKQYVVNPQATIKVGLIKRLVRNYAGYLFGFITPKDGSKDIYFGENEIHPSLLLLLTEGLEVKAEVEQSARGPRARQVWKAEGEALDGA